VENAVEVRLSPPIEQLKPAFSRCFEVRQEKTTEYTLTAIGRDGREATASLTIRRGAARPAAKLPPGEPLTDGALSIGDFNANPGRIARGAAAVLCFSVRNASAVRVEPGAVKLGAVQRGCFYVTPEATTTYTLTAEGGGKSVRKQLTVAVE
jgi:hypothetical protein